MKKGYIEGYYGRLLSQQGRQMIINELNNLSMDFYIYGPKEDPFHRIKWNKDYPLEQMDEFEQLIGLANSNQVKFYFAISPGLSIEASSKRDIELLKKKLLGLINLGCKNFALFMDDLEFSQLSDINNDNDLGKEHGLLANEIKDFLFMKGAEDLLFCPTIYCKRFSKGDLYASKYLESLSITLDKDIPIFWTGNEVVSKEIHFNDLKELSEIFSNELIIWDNFFANDYCPGRVYLGELTRRELKQGKIQALGLNPTGLPNVDSLILNRLSEGKTTEDIFEKFLIPEAFKKLLPFFDSPFSEVETEINLKELREIQHEVCIEWKSPLQVEIAPFLWEFYNHLSLLEKYLDEEENALEEWAKRRYSSPLLEIIRNRKN
tara:strand:- start:5921 stop:7051 length:1131 start_codon:yes stop_codon:yes gene_type:complete